MGVFPAIITTYANAAEAMPWIFYYFGFVYFLAILLYLATSLGRSCISTDPRWLAGHMRLGWWTFRSWVVPVEKVERVVFHGGSFFSTPLEARIYADEILIRGRLFFRVRDKRLKRLRISLETLKRHPSLLQRLIDMAESQEPTGRERKTLENARRLARRLARRDRLPRDPQSLMASLERPSANGRAFDRFERIVMLIVHVLLFVALAVLVFLHLRGSDADFAMPALPLLLIVGAWHRPAFELVTTRRNVRILLSILLTLALLAAALFIWYVPAIWVLLAAWMVVSISGAIAYSLGRKAGRRVLVATAIGCIAYGVFVAVYFSNPDVRRVERIFQIRYRMVFFTQSILSPDGKTLTLSLMEFARRPEDEYNRFVPVRDSLGKAVTALARSVLNMGPIYPAPHESTQPVLFVPTDGSTPKELIVKTPMVAFLRGWSPDSSRIPLNFTMSGSESQVWLAEPATDVFRSLVRTSTSLSLWWGDPWTSDGLKLKGVLYTPDDPNTTYTDVLVDAADGSITRVAPWPPDDETTSRSEGLSDFDAFSRKRSPDGQWLAIAEEDGPKSHITIQDEATSSPVASFAVPVHVDSTDMRWSPDSHRLAVSNAHRTWVYDRRSDRTFCVRTRRRCSSPVWAPDSRSFYYARSIAFPMIGLEIVKVTLRD